MKKLFILFLFPLYLLAQQPYYNGLNFNKSGLSLKADLAKRVTTTHTNFLTYTPGIWGASKVTDVDPNNSSKVLLFYGFDNGSTLQIDDDKTRGVNDNGGRSTQWNREHVFPRSLGAPNLGSEGPGSDSHHLRPADPARNSDRSNRKFANASGNSRRINGNWYPGDEWKGDVARMMMYMYIRYGNRCLPSAVGVGNSAATPDAMIDLFLKWNAEDPPTPIEDQRNTYHDSKATYAQGNRNPFIDNPYLATLIWGGPKAQDRWSIATDDKEAPTIVRNIKVIAVSSNNATILWNKATDNIAVTTYEIYINGILNTTSSNTTISIEGLKPKTDYEITILAKDAKGNKSPVSASVKFVTKKSNTTAKEIFFSEYIEGSGFNKAIEIANFTGANVDLSEYNLRRQSNGSGSWDFKYNLSGRLNQGDVIVLANSLTTDNVLKSKADVLIVDSFPDNPSPLNFNGNDPIGLFKNDILIDIVGTFNNSNDFGKNITLQRKESITAPNTIFNKKLEWNELVINYFLDLGTHKIKSNLNLKQNDTKLIFEVKGISETCSVSNNGKIEIKAQTRGNYNVAVNNGNIFKQTSFTTKTTFSKLKSGYYDVVVTNKETFLKYAYKVKVTEPNNLNVKFEISKEKNVLNLNLSGGSNYFITLNNKNFVTRRNSFSLKLITGTNKIFIKTDKDCQGTFVKQISIDTDLPIIYPNPFKETLFIDFNKDFTSKPKISVFDIKDNLIYQKVLNNRRLNLRQLNSGVYLIKVDTPQKSTIHRVVKK